MSKTKLKQYAERLRLLQRFGIDLSVPSNLHKVMVCGCKFKSEDYGFTYIAREVCPEHQKEVQVGKKYSVKEE